MRLPARGDPHIEGGWLAYLTSRSTSLKKSFEPRNKRIESVRDRRRNLIEPNIPENFKATTKAVKLPHVKHLIRSGQAILGASLPTPVRPPLWGAKERLGVQAIEEAEHVERYLADAYWRMLKDRDWYGQITDAMAADAEATWKLTSRIKRWSPLRNDDEKDAAYNERVQEKQRSLYPFKVDHVPSATWYSILHDDDGLAECMEITTREWDEVYETYYKTLKDQVKAIGAVTESIHGGRVCEVWEYWNRSKLVVVAKEMNMVVYESKHPYERPPYYHANFSTTSVHDHGFETEGLADPICHLQDTLEQLGTIRLNLGFIGGFPYARLVQESPDAPPVDWKKTKLVLEPGGTIQAPSGYRWEWVPVPDVGAALLGTASDLQEIVNDVSLAPILYGKGSGQMGGPAMSGLTALARSVFGTGLTNLARAFDEMAGNMLFVIDKVAKTEVPVLDEPTGEWLELGPKHIHGYYLIHHKMEPIIPAEDQARYISLADAQSRGLVTKNHVREHARILQIDSPIQMDEEVTVEHLSEAQELMKALLFFVLKQIRATEEKGNPETELLKIMGINPETLAFQAGAPAAVPPVAPAGITPEGGPVQPAGIAQAFQPGMTGLEGNTQAVAPNGAL